MKFDPKNPKYYNSGTQASLPGRVPIKLIVYLRYFTSARNKLVWLLIGWVVAVAVAVTYGMHAGIAISLMMIYRTVVSILKFQAGYVRIQELAWFGCLNPAKVISEKPH